jgi:hypothetical protein
MTVCPSCKTVFEIEERGECVFVDGFTQGAWSAVIREPVEQETYLEMAFGQVKNTCWVWREDGPSIKEWKEKAKN